MIPAAAEPLDGDHSGYSELRASAFLREIRVIPVELIAMLPFALVRLLSRPGAHWGSQYQVGAAIFLSASKAREKTRSHREHGILL
jgi:hypothetical protein